jgi:hypothetical protein
MRAEMARRVRHRTGNYADEHAEQKSAEITLHFGYRLNLNNENEFLIEKGNCLSNLEALSLPERAPWHESLTSE